MTASERMKAYWQDIRNGTRQKPERSKNRITRKRVRCNSRWVRGNEIILTIYPHGELGFREPRHRAEFKLSLADAHRQAVLVTTSKITARAKELKRQGERNPLRKARKELL